MASNSVVVKKCDGAATADQRLKQLQHCLQPAFRLVFPELVIPQPLLKYLDKMGVRTLENLGSLAGCEWFDDFRIQARELDSLATICNVISIFGEHAFLSATKNTKPNEFREAIKQMDLSIWIYDWLKQKTSVLVVQPTDEINWAEVKQYDAHRSLKEIFLKISPTNMDKARIAVNIVKKFPTMASEMFEVEAFRKITSPYAASYHTQKPVRLVPFSIFLLLGLEKEEIVSIYALYPNTTRDYFSLLKNYSYNGASMSDTCLKLLTAEKMTWILELDPGLATSQRKFGSSQPCQNLLEHVVRENYASEVRELVATRFCGDKLCFGKSKIPKSEMQRTQADFVNILSLPTVLPQLKCLVLDNSQKWTTSTLTSVMSQLANTPALIELQLLLPGKLMQEEEAQQAVTQFLTKKCVKGRKVTLLSDKWGNQYDDPDYHEYDYGWEESRDYDNYSDAGLVSSVEAALSTQDLGPGFVPLEELTLKLGHAFLIKSVDPLNAALTKLFLSDSIGSLAIQPNTGFRDPSEPLSDWFPPACTTSYPDVRLGCLRLFGVASPHKYFPSKAEASELSNLNHVGWVPDYFSERDEDRKTPVDFLETLASLPSLTSLCLEVPQGWGAGVVQDLTQPLAALLDRATLRDLRVEGNRGPDYEYDWEDDRPSPYRIQLETLLQHLPNSPNLRSLLLRGTRLDGEKSTKMLHEVIMNDQCKVVTVTVYIDDRFYTLDEDDSFDEDTSDEDDSNRRDLGSYLLAKEIDFVTKLRGIGLGHVQGDKMTKSSLVGIIEKARQHQAYHLSLLYGLLREKPSFWSMETPADTDADAATTSGRKRKRSD